MPKELKFLLINPTAPLWRVADGRSPSGKTKAFRFSMLPSLYVAAAMPPSVKTQILDEDLEPIDFDTDADLIGISLMTYNAPRAYEIADKFRREKGKPVILGGYHPTFMPQEAKQHADAVCIGEAEPNVRRMIEDFAAGRLQPFYDHGLADLAGLPIPDRGLIDRSAYITPNAVQATRGCPYRCRFCSVAAFNRYQYRTRPVDEVIDELQTLGRRLVFIDDNIVANRDYAVELFSKMIPLKKYWAGQGSINLGSDRQLLELAARSGCRGMFFGLESLSQENLNSSRKLTNRATDYVRTIEKIHAAGIGVFAGIVLGMDDDRPDVFRRTLAFLDEARVDVLQATVMTPFPGTPLFDQMQREGRIRDKDWGKYDFNHVVFEPKHMAPETLKHGHDWLCSSFYSRRRVWRRLWRAAGYLGIAPTVAAIAPLNFGYRYRCKAAGLFAAGKRFQENGRSQDVANAPVELTCRRA